jgi:sugar/nucleoside kinase (ribokinase family)
MDCIVVGDIFFDIMIRGNPFELGLVCGGTSYNNSITIKPGGAGNVATGLSRLGGTAQFIGKAGKDTLGIFYQNNLIKEGVKTKLIFDNFNPTGILISFVDRKGERSFLVSRGANDFLLPKEIEQCSNYIVKSKYLFISGYSVVNHPQREAILKAIDIAKSGDVKVVFDPSAHNLIKQKRAVFENIVNLCDIITLNLEEAKALTKCTRIQELVKLLSERVPLVALRMGEQGCVLVTPNRTLKCPGNKANCVDSTGAGDAFASALIFGLTNGFRLETTVRLANWYASYNIKKLGPRVFPSKAEIRKYLSKITK